MFLDFLNIEPESFGIDISDLSLKVIKLERKGRFLSLDSWGEIKIEPGIIEGGEIKNEEALVEVIKKGIENVRGKKLKSRNVIVSLPENKAFFQIIKMPKMNKKELESAVPFEAENYIPMPANDVYLDFEIISNYYENSESLNVLVVAIPRKIVDSYLSCLRKSGLNVQALEIESEAITRALIKNKISPFPVLIIDFGRSITSFIFFAGRSIQFTCSVPISSSDVTEAIAGALGVNLIEAEKIKLKYGFNARKKSSLENNKSRKIIKATRPILMDLAEQIRKYINYYQTHASKMGFSAQKEKIEKIILCGRGSNLKGLKNFLSLEIKIPVELGNPWLNILAEPLKEVPGLSYEESLGYVTALGLALRSYPLKKRGL